MANIEVLRADLQSKLVQMPLDKAIRIMAQGAIESMDENMLRKLIAECDEFFRLLSKVAAESPARLAELRARA